MSTIQIEAVAAVKSDLSPVKSEFLHEFHPSGPWVLSAIRDGQCRTATFRDAAQMVRWIDDQQRDSRNIYFLPGDARGPLSKKATKADMTGSRYLWVDLDAPKGTAWGNQEGVEAAMEELHQRLAAFSVKPSIVISSGGGLQAYWRLEETLTDHLQIEVLNKALAAALGGDHCHNVDRIMRLPGTVNFPTATKRAAGRSPVMATVVSMDVGRAYSLTAFKEARDARSIWLTPLTVDGPQMARRESPTAVAPNPTPTSGIVSGRSESLYALVCQLLESAKSEAEVVAELMANHREIAQKHIHRGDLDKEVARIAGKWRAKQAQKGLPAGQTMKPRDIKLAAGDQARIVDEALEVLQAHGGMYERGGELVRRVGERLITVEPEWLADFLSRRATFYRNKPDGNGDWV